MTVKDIVEKFGLKVFAGEAGLDKEATGGYTCDLLSDVTGHIKKGDIWVTIQTHRNLIGLASLKDVAAIVIVKKLKPTVVTKDLAEKAGIPLLGTDMESFEFSAELYNCLKR